MVVPPRITLHKFNVPIQHVKRHGLLSDGPSPVSEGPSDAIFAVKGQGTVSVKPTPIDTTQLTIILSSSTNPHAGFVGLSVNSTRAVLWVQAANTMDQRVLSTSSEAAYVLDAPEKNQPYWLSFDAQNKRFRYGKGEMMRVNMLVESSWSKGDPSAELYKSLDHVVVHGTNDSALVCLRTAVNVDPAPHLCRPEDVSLQMIAENTHTVASDLPFACFQLYNNVAGPGMKLDTADFPDFSRAIQHSILTKGALCYEKLQEKDKIFGYLRVTLDANAGESPGSPYVCEIWPFGNGSPIHDHGQACAVIKVLHGNINVSWYSGLAVGINEPWATANVEKDEVTFLTPSNYQIHRLHNDKEVHDASSGNVVQDFAATIQCYRYLPTDDVHYEYFDYINDKGETKEHFEPDSDWDFLTFKNLIRAEWGKVPRGAGVGAQGQANGSVAPVDEAADFIQGESD
ncbi:unnamed protein product [Tilletia laevis]|uniref:Cysteine dioxygenase n=3 Tax=Tilletia TaxID=13289 RepID=A0A8X7ST90_9BASI|nr:hypothetical protein CF336_g7847 [Tilletia laevis]KAE8184803.1 hypothetical protein CF328_g7742 [Tilletia controversa]KAE8243959.1 hypothetical protein A4X03_0g7646 [Tilletia caries]KAE8186026.1 hypothetical protein CF335_g7560 [Tilletia laevis]KAE8239302.1 hypothetical protein A4X06_0g8366 [Tilletia controversa]